MQWKRRYITVLMMVVSPCCLLLSQINHADEVSSGPGDEASSLNILKQKFAGASASFEVRKIYITGNKKTKDEIILREIPFKEGEHYLLQELVKKFEDSQRQLMNTSLFHDVTVTLKSFEGYNVDIQVTVQERWYLFPLPYFKYIDRNLNQWLVENHARLNRVNYGIKVLYNNATGHNDKLNVWLINGYTKQISLNYDRLYFDKKMKFGVNTGVALGKNREVNYSTVNNKQLFYKDVNKYIRSYFKTYAELTYRRAIHTRHRLGISYTDERVEDTIVTLNPTYFKDRRNRIRYPEVYYSMSYYNVDYIPYPLKGYIAEVSFIKRGFNNIINLWQLNVKGGGNWKVANNTYFSVRATGTLKFPFRQPYINQRLFGYSDFSMQGYEYFVIDGVAGGCIKTTIYRQLLNFNMYVRKKKDQPPLRIPFRIFAKAYTNAGYVHNPYPGVNGLSNQMLYSGGVGLDIVTFYDFTLKLEWSFNQLGQNGLYLHRKSNF